MAKKTISPLKRLEQALVTQVNNAKHYCELTNSIQQPSTRSTWLERFQERAQFARQMYAENNQCIADCRDLNIRYHEESLKDYHDGLKLTDLTALCKSNVHLAFFQRMKALTNKQGIENPFLLEKAFRSYEQDMERLMPHSEITFSFYVLMMQTSYQIAQLDDKEANENTIGYAKKILSFEAEYDKFSSDELRVSYLSAFRMLLDVNFILKGLISADEAIDTWKHYHEFVAKHPIASINERKFPELKTIRYYADNFVPVYAIVYHRNHEDAVHDAWLHEEWAKYAEHYVVEPRTFQRYAFAMLHLGRWTPDEAVSKVSDFHTMLIKKLPKNPNIEDVLTALYSFQESIILLDDCHLCFEEKQHLVLQGCSVLLNQVRNCKNRQINYELSSALCRFICDPNVNKYLNTKQRIQLISSTMRSTLVQTYAHCSMVAQIAEEILDAIIRYQPELLVGYMGIGSKDEVQGKAYELNHYLTFAAMLHDIGKLSIIQVINNIYYNLMNHEFEILKLHPENGLRFVALDPAFEPYKDVILGHHKWYNGQGGYPASFDNTQSPYRIFIDIISIADCMEAATDNLGRNYRKEKEFSDLFDEMFSQSGTRYNPIIMQLIRSKTDVYLAISELIHVGWEYNYYDVYLDFFGKR